MFPIVFQNLMLASVAVADAIMLGSVEQNSMAAVSLATQIQFIQNMFLGAIVASVAILGAQYWGKGDQDTLNDIFCMALRLCGGSLSRGICGMRIFSAISDADLYE